MLCVGAHTLYMYLQMHIIHFYTRKVGAKFTCELMSQGCCYAMQQESRSNGIGDDAIPAAAEGRRDFK